MYYAVLFNELREQDPNRPAGDNNEEDDIRNNRKELYGSGHTGAGGGGRAVSGNHQSGDKSRTQSTASKMLGKFFSKTGSTHIGNVNGDDDDYDEFDELSDEDDFL